MKTVKIAFNNNDLASIKKAERAKRVMENNGAKLVETIVNSVTGECILIYKKT